MVSDYIKKLLKDKARLKKWKRITLALSCVVVFCVVYALTLPAITLEGKTICGMEEHTHTEECYQDDKLICGKEEHQHTEDCYEKEEEQPVEENTNDENEGQSLVVEDEIVNVPEIMNTEEGTQVQATPYDLSSHKDKIDAIKFVYKKTEIVNGKEQTTESDVPTDGTLLTYDNLSMTYRVLFKDIAATTLTQSGGVITYQLPDQFIIKGSINKNITSDNKVIGTIDVSSSGLVEIKYNSDFMNSLEENTTVKGSFDVDAQINMNSIDSSTGKVTIKTPTGDITLNYGLDYLEHYGNVAIEKSCKKEKTSDYIEYTIKLTAGDGGCKNVYVVDQFTQNKEIVKYVDIPQKETKLNTAKDGYKPFENSSNSSSAGTIYLTNAPGSDQKIPDAVTGTMSEPGSIVWKVAAMDSNEVRTLTYYVKLNDTTKNLYNYRNKNVVNNAQVYTKKDDSSQIYNKGNGESTFTPTIKIDTDVMKKSLLTQDGENYKKDKDGNYLVNYKIEFNYGSDNNCSIKGFQFRDYLDYWDIYSDSKMLPYISYVEDSVVLHVKKANETVYKEYKGKDITVGWTQGTEVYSAYNENSTRFKVYKLNNESITINPGDSYYVTYTLKIKPEVYAAMQANSVKIKNRYVACSEDNELDKVFNDKLELSEYKWVDKNVSTVIAEDTSIKVDGTKYAYENNQLKQDFSNVSSFDVFAGSYKYTVVINKSDGKFNITNVTLKDVLNKDVMKYVGYMKVTAYDGDTKKETKWVNIEGQQSFSLKLSDLGWKDNCYSYTFEYYATPKDLTNLTNVIVNNTFTLNGDVKRGNNGIVFPFKDVKAFKEIRLEGSYNLNVNKKAWYYENPTQNAIEWQNGKHYWVIEVNGSKVREGTKIKDVVNTDEKSSYLHNDSLVGVYKGDLKDLTEYKSIDDLPKDSLVGSDYYTAEFSNSKGFSGNNNYSEVVLTTKKNFDLLENEKIYIVVKTEPQELPTVYRDVYTYKNGVEIKHKGETEFTKVNVASQELYGGTYILKELGQTFEIKSGIYKNISKDKDTDQPESKIYKKGLNGDGIYASWAFKVNYGGDLKGDYRVLEEIPEGMELSYIRIKWRGSKALKISSQPITDHGEWKEMTITADGDDSNNKGITTTYYVNGKQALIKLGSFNGIHERDNYSVDVQVVCRVTDPEVLLGGETKTFTNRVTLQSADGTKNYVSATANAKMAKTLLDKTHTQDGQKQDSQKINYTITANEYGQKLLENSNDPLTLVDELSNNLILDVPSIKATNIRDGNSVEIKKISYDSEKNSLEIQIPDGIPVKITYSCKVNVAPKEEVRVVNKVYWKNYMTTGGKEDVIPTFSYNLNAAGTTEITTHPQLKIIKYDSDGMKPLNGATFEIHECEFQNEKIEYTSKSSIIVTSQEDGTVTIPTDKFQMEFNKIYEIKETKTLPGYVLDEKPYYIMRVKKDGNNYPQQAKDYIEYQKTQDKQHYLVAYDADNFNVQMFNAKKGITVQKLFKNNVAETDTKPVSGTYWFGLYDENNVRIDKVSITYEPNDQDTKTARFGNIELNKTYYIYELDSNGKPIEASKEAIVNTMNYQVVYENNGKTTNSAQNGDTVIVTNKSRTKILPSTGGYGSLLYRISGAMLVLASLIVLTNINKKNHLDDTSKKRRKK